MICVLRGKAEAIDRSETFRYLGVSGEDEVALRLFAELEGEALGVQDLRAVYETYPLSQAGDQLDLGFAKVNSKSLSIYLQGCKRILLFACTAGVGIDRLIAGYSRLSPAKAAMVQAMGSSMAESWCNDLCAQLGREYNLKTSRFSCGYGDLPLTLQREIFSALGVTKRIGISLSENCFMTPSKSVTAIVGIKE